MSALQAAIFGLVQGLTEFLPVSSSAHLVLVPFFTGWPDPGLAFDVALHWGTLLAVVIYFRRDILNIVRDAFRSLGGARGPEYRLPWQIAAATVPGVIAGLLLEKYAETAFRSPPLLAVTLSAMGLLLAAADRLGSKSVSLSGVTWAKALTIGICQSLALIPGVSRSGVTMTTGLFLGLEKTAAVRFSFLLSIPITLGAGLLKIDYLFANLANPQFLAGLAASAVSGFLAIHFLLNYVRSKSFMPFVVYRLALAAAIVLKLAF